MSLELVNLNSICGEMTLFDSKLVSSVTEKKKLGKCLRRLPFEILNRRVKKGNQCFRKIRLITYSRSPSVSVMSPERAGNMCIHPVMDFTLLLFVTAFTTS